MSKCLIYDNVFVRYEFQLVGDKKYGSFKNGEWNGMIRELRDRVRRKSHFKPSSL